MIEHAIIVLADYKDDEEKVQQPNRAFFFPLALRSTGFPFHKPEKPMNSNLLIMHWERWHRGRAHICEAGN